MYSKTKLCISRLKERSICLRPIALRTTPNVTFLDLCMSTNKLSCTIQIYKDSTFLFIRYQDVALFPSLPNHHHRHRCPGHVACGWQGRRRTHLHLPGGLAEACTCNRNGNKRIKLSLIHDTTHQSVVVFFHHCISLYTHKISRILLMF